MDVPIHRHTHTYIIKHKSVIQSLWETSIFIIWGNHTEKWITPKKKQWQGLSKFDKYDNATDEMV